MKIYRNQVFASKASGRRIRVISVSRSVTAEKFDDCYVKYIDDSQGKKTLSRGLLYSDSIRRRYTKVQ